MDISHHRPLLFVSDSAHPKHREISPREDGKTKIRGGNYGYTAASDNDNICSPYFVTVRNRKNLGGYMARKRMSDRRVRDFGPPSGCAERRCIADRRKIEVSEATYEEFEMLMAALGFRNKTSRHDKA